jgi:hypothetical protein
MSRPARDIAGQTFGRLTALYRTTRKDSRGTFYWRFSCVCGKEKEAVAANVISGVTRSCGCLRRENCARQGMQRRARLRGAPAVPYSRFGEFYLDDPEELDFEGY